MPEPLLPLDSKRATGVSSLAMRFSAERDWSVDPSKTGFFWQMSKGHGLTPDH